MDALHRILSGQAVTRTQLIGGGIFIAVWSGIDFIMFGDFVMTKLGFNAVCR